MGALKSTIICKVESSGSLSRVIPAHALAVRALTSSRVRGMRSSPGPSSLGEPPIVELVPPAAGALELPPLVALLPPRNPGTAVAPPLPPAGVMLLPPPAGSPSFTAGVLQAPKTHTIAIDPPSLIERIADSLFANNDLDGEF
jgi:hypothetical protein